MKGIHLILTILLLTSCTAEIKETSNTNLIELKQINSIPYGEYIDIKDIKLYDGAYYTIAWNQSKIVKIQNGKILSVSPGRGNNLGEFKSVPENLIVANDTVYVIERDSRFINRYSLDLEPIDRVKLPSKFPKSRTIDIVSDSLFVISSLIADQIGLHLYNLNLDHIRALKLNHKVGHILWDIKYISAVDDKIIVGYPFSGRVEILSYEGEQLNYFDTGTDILDIQVPNFRNDNEVRDRSDGKVPDGVSFLSIQALNEDYIIYFTPQNNNGEHEIYFVDFNGRLIGKSILKGTFQYIYAIEGKIFGYNQDTQKIEVFEVLL